MSKEAHGRRRTLRVLGSSVAAVALFATAVAARAATADPGGDGDVTLEFAQWWEPELPDGAFRGLMDQFEEREPGHQGRAAQRAVRLDEGAALRRRRRRHDVRRRRPRRRLGQRLRQPGRDRRPDRAHGRERLRRQRARQPDPGRRRDLHDPRRQLRLPDVHERRPARAGRRHRAARRTRTRVRGCRARRSPGSATTPAAGSCRSRSRRRTASRTTSCRGSGRPAARCSTTASPTLTNDDVTSAVDYIQGLWDDGVDRPRRLHHEGAGQGRGVHQRPRRHDDRLARAHQPDPRDATPT